MKLSKLLAPTLREDPSEAEVLSHKLMLRAGMIQKLAAGVYNQLPLGFIVLQNIIRIVREEMNASGAQEVLMPTLLPAELWQETGRWDVYGKELFRIKDRHDREFCLGPTHEEVITDIVRKNIRSYRQLPITLYQIQGKFRDEIRPRFGVMRSREFIMKDAYSFHTSESCAEKEYKNMHDTYCRIFDRMGLKYRVVEADPGAIGGGFSQEFMVLADTGEEEIFYCEKCGYSASRDGCAIGKKEGIPISSNSAETQKVNTPNTKTIEEVSSFLNIKSSQIIKTLVYITEKGFIAALVKGDHAINEAKLKKALEVEKLELADSKTIEKITGAPVGFAGPVGLKQRDPGITIFADRAVVNIDQAVSGANEKDRHLINISYNRDYVADRIGDIRYAQADDQCPKCASGFKICRGIEVGHIFKLGTKYSQKMKAVFIDEDNKEKTCTMGCYGIGVSRIAAAAIEQNYDKDGIVWPMPLAPYKVAIIPGDINDSAQNGIVMRIYDELRKKQIEVLLDDRDERLGVKLKDIDLIGIPIKVIVAAKGMKENKVEIKRRKDGSPEFIAIDQAVGKIEKLVVDGLG